MTVSLGPPAPPQAENFLDHRFVRLVYEGSGEERRDRDWRKSAARGGGGQGLIGRVTSTLAPNGGYALGSTPRIRQSLLARAGAVGPDLHDLPRPLHRQVQDRKSVV